MPRGRPHALKLRKLHEISLGLALRAVLPDRDLNDVVMLALQIAADDCTAEVAEGGRLSWTVPNMMDNRLEYLRKQMGDPYWTDRLTADHPRASERANQESDYVSASVLHLVVAMKAEHPALVDYLCQPLAQLQWSPGILSKVRLQAAAFATARLGINSG